MSMDKSAIQEITNNAIAATRVAASAMSDCSPGYVPVVALPKDFQINILEKYLPNRTRLRGEFSTSEITAFAKYCPQDQAFPVFVDEEKMKAVAVLNFGTDDLPGHCDHTATLALRKTAPFRALLAINGHPALQRSLAEWMEDWRDFIKCTEVQGGSAINIAQAIASVRKITVEATSKKDSAVGSFSEEKSDFERLEAKGDALPSFIEFTCEPYQGLPARTFVMRVAIHTAGEVKFTLHTIQLELHEQEMAAQMAEEIRKAMQSKQANILLGAFSTS